MSRLELLPRLRADPPLPVEGGITARSRRGAIGETWWSQRFIALLESFGVGSRLTARAQLRARRAGRRARCRAGDRTGAGAGLALHAVPCRGSGPRSSPNTSGGARRRRWPRRRCRSRNCSRARCRTRSRSCSRPASSRCSRRSYRELTRDLLLSGHGQPVQAHRRRLLHPRRALRRGPVPDLRAGAAAPRRSCSSSLRARRGADRAARASGRRRRALTPAERGAAVRSARLASGPAARRSRISASARSPAPPPTPCCAGWDPRRSRAPGATSPPCSRPHTRGSRRPRNSGRWPNSTTAGAPQRARGRDGPMVRAFGRLLWTDASAVCRTARAISLRRAGRASTCDSSPDRSARGQAACSCERVMSA